jgi:hypothetical protein
MFRVAIEAVAARRAAVPRRAKTSIASGAIGLAGSTADARPPSEPPVAALHAS